MVAFVSIVKKKITWNFCFVCVTMNWLKTLNGIYSFKYCALIAIESNAP